jgi:hypothetical protein
MWYVLTFLVGCGVGCYLSSLARWIATGDIELTDDLADAAKHLPSIRSKLMEFELEHAAKHQDKP